MIRPTRVLIPRLLDGRPYYALSPLRGGATKGWSKVRGCGSDSEVVGWVDVANRNFVVGDRGGRGLGAKLADFRIEVCDGGGFEVSTSSFEGLLCRGAGIFVARGWWRRFLFLGWEVHGSR